MALAGGLAACAIAARDQAQSRMEKSEDAYRQCLFHHNIADALAHP